MVSHKDVFWKALILTIIVFSLGVFLGFTLEDKRIVKIQQGYKTMELNWADAKLQSLYYQSINDPLFCNASINQNLIFADRAYQQGLLLEKYEQANPLTPEMLLDKERYALLKVEFWLNSITLKEKCKANYTNLVYFFTNDPNIEQKSAQDVQSVILKDLKEKYGADLMLIPLPIDFDISIINIMREAYNITTTPSILINEKLKLEGVHGKDELDNTIRKGVV